MKFTLKWLKEHLLINGDLNELPNILDQLGLEVEEYNNPGIYLKKFKIAKVLEVKNHPYADKLYVCKVFDGIKKLQIVCGAKNVKMDLITVLAPIGSELPPDKNGNILKIKKSKIRGIESEGMLCSEQELGVSESSSGIIEIFSKNIGDSFSKHIDDELITYEIAITPNRGDCAGVRGIARDLNAKGFGELKKLRLPKIKYEFETPIKVINLLKKRDCPQFSIRLIQNVKNSESPEWLKKRFVSCNLKIISSLVDVTNFFTIDFCRPLHVFDFDKIEGDITIRYSKKNETFLGLDEVDYMLEEGIIVICDKKGIISIAGILGGLRTACDFDTKNVLLESAYFESDSIALSGRKLNISSDARYRFERGVDPMSTDDGINLATQMIVDNCGGKIGSIVKDNEYKKKDKIITIDQNEINNTLGTYINESFIKNTFKKLGCGVHVKNNIFKVSIPTWRNDLNLPEDLVEEVGRIYGYENINDQVIHIDNFLTKDVTNTFQKLRKKIGRLLVSRGITEIISWSFTDNKIDEFINPNEKKVHIKNPISSDLSILRSNLIGNILNFIKKNEKKGFKNLSFFEIGPIFFGSKPGQQDTLICGIRSGLLFEKNWLEKKREIDLYDIKADLFAALRIFNLTEEKLVITQNSKNYYHPKICGSVLVGKEKIADFGMIHPSVIKFFDLSSNIHAFEISFSKILKYFSEQKVSRKSFFKSDYQSSKRDFSFLVNKHLFSSEIKKVIQLVNKELIKEVKIFDSYEEKELGDNKKAIAIEVTIQSDLKTLSEEDIDKVCKEIILNAEKKCNARLR